MRLSENECNFDQNFGIRAEGPSASDGITLRWPKATMEWPKATITAPLAALLKPRRGLIDGPKALVCIY